MQLLYTIIAFSVPAIFLSWVLPEKYSKLPIAVATFIYLLVDSYYSLFALLFATLSTYLILKYVKDKKWVPWIIIIEVAVVLVVYKLNDNFHLLNIDISLVGISYYSFRLIHVAIEHYKKSLQHYFFLDYVSYLFFLPVIIIGPINLFQDFIKDWNRRRWNSQLASYGLERILYGLVKVSFLGNYLVSIKLNSFIKKIALSKPYLLLYLDTISFTSNAYFQFSGYSDVAIGLSALAGFKIIENFNYPFLAKNIADFWTRWHISLSNWCREYVFYPIMAKSRSAILSVVVSMLVLGLWHEISFKYVVWALLQGSAIFIWSKYSKTRIHATLNRSRLNLVLSWVINFHFVIFSFYILKFKNLESFFVYIQKVLDV